ncbi:Protein MIZU-KUSSEI 1 [Bienertia sinuspersici]
MPGPLQQSSASPRRSPPPPLPPHSGANTPISSGPASPSRAPVSNGPMSPRAPISLQAPSQRKNPSKSNKLLRRMRSVIRSFPIVSPTCRIPISNRLSDGHIHGGTRITGTLFGYRKSEGKLGNPRKSAMPPNASARASYPNREAIARHGVRLSKDCLRVKTGYGIKREATDDDLSVMQMLHAVSMGAGVLPSGDGNETPDGELTYMRAFFERVVGSKDSETYYMMNPDGNGGPELSIFFVRI